MIFVKLQTLCEDFFSGYTVVGINLAFGLFEEESAQGSGLTKMP